MRMANGRQNGIWVLALVVGFVAFVIWDQSRGGEAVEDARPGVTRAQPVSTAPTPGRQAPSPEAKPEAEEDPGPPTSGVM